MRILLTLLCLLTVEALHSQAKLTFDSTVVNFGKIVQGTYLFENIWFTNTGNEPIIISRASTSDGGSYTEWPKEPIAAGQRGAIRFRYDTQRIGVFNRSISVTYNNNSTQITAKGEVIYKATTIAVNQQLIDLGEIYFGTVASAKFTITNTGNEILYINFDSYNYKHQDLFYATFSESIQNQPPKNQYATGENIDVNFVFRNIYGQSGPFERNLKIRYNSHDTLSVIVKGTYTGFPSSSVIYERNRILTYNNHSLSTIKELNWSGKVERTHYFLNSNFQNSEK
jgi:hypothetical protein